jgi:two-component system CheB/CheR fusion protein
VVVNEREEIVRFSGSEAGHYIEPASGTASLSLFALLKKPLRPAVREALRAAASGDPAIREGTAFRIDGKVQTVSIIVEQIAESRSGPKLYVVAFKVSGKAGSSAAATAVADGANASVEALEHELGTTKVQLQSAIGELEASATNRA